MEDLVRKDVRQLSALSDLKLKGKKGNTKEGSYQERRKLRKFGAVKDDGEEVIHEPFIRIYRKKKSSDRKAISDCLMKHFTFSYLEPSIRDALIDKFEFCRVEQGQYLIHQGDNASCFFLLHEGTMAVEINGEVKKELNYKDGGFGELALLFNAPRSASIRAQTNCFLWYIDRRTFKGAVEEVISTTHNQNRKFIDKCPQLSELTNGQRQALTDIAMSQFYEKNAQICKQGEQASSFFILKAGRICRKRNGGKDIDYIEKGQLFQHEIALNQGFIRQATLITEENSQVLALSISEVRACLGKDLQAILLRNKVKALLKNEKFFQDLSKNFAIQFLDAFQTSKCEKGIVPTSSCSKEIKKDKIILVLQGSFEVNFTRSMALHMGKLQNSKSQKQIPSKQNLNRSRKEIKSKEADINQILGLKILRQAAQGILQEKQNEFTVRCVDRGGKIAFTTLQEIEKALGCTLPQAAQLSKKQQTEKSNRVSRVFQMRELTKTFQLNQFSARKILGSGAYGKVLLVTDEKENRHYALKCISKKPLVKHKHLAFIKQEKETLNLMSSKESPFFVRYYRSFRDKYYIYFLTEYIEGRDLFDVIRTIGILTLEQARFYCALLIHMLETFHQEGIIYRDLKPQNIMVCRDGYLKLVDMGTCKQMQENQNKTFSFIGTPQYMAPEVFIHKGYSFNADLWSLGAILYELLAGKNPFVEVDTDDMKEIYDQIMTNKLEFPSFMKDNNQLMRNAKLFISQLLDKSNPNNRLGGSYKNLKSHPFFKDFNWDSLMRKTMTPAYYIKNEYLVNEEKIRMLPTRSVLTFLKDWNCQLPKLSGVPEEWDKFFEF